MPNMLKVQMVFMVVIYLEYKTQYVYFCLQVNNCYVYMYLP